jgi:hypothetical protein
MIYKLHMSINILDKLYNLDTRELYLIYIYRRNTK